MNFLFDDDDDYPDTPEGRYQRLLDEYKVAQSERKRLSDENEKLESENRLLSSYKDYTETYYSDLLPKICKYLTRKKMESIEIYFYDNLFRWYSKKLLNEFSRSDNDPNLTKINKECLSEAKRLGLVLLKKNGAYYLDGLLYPVKYDD